MFSIKKPVNLFSIFLLATMFTCGSKKSGGSDASGTNASCVSFKLLKGETSEPSVVKLFFQLKTCDGAPLAGVKPEQFLIKEDGKEVSIYESNQGFAMDTHTVQISTVLLLDMSGSIIKSGNLPALQQAAKAFVQSISQGQSVALYTFDGRPKLQLLQDFTNNTSTLQSKIDSLSNYKIVDTSTNLNGAIIQGLGVLQSRQESMNPGVLFAGSLVVFTDGTDQAAYHSDEDAEQAASSSSFNVYTIGLGGEVDDQHLKAVGKDGSYFARDVSRLTSAFANAATDIKAMANSYYILAYCSPKRAGHHTLELSLRGADGHANFDFDAGGFKGGCTADDFLPRNQNCQPNCNGKECGDDGCGGSCGTCENGKTCNSNGKCVENCTPDCNGKECGDDGCGGSCGTCDNGKTCNSDGKCVEHCQPKTCQDLGYECGQADDGCGGTLDCGGCGEHQACENHKCVENCTPKTCDDLGYKCGQADDGCGGTLDCGTCADNEACKDHKCVKIVWTDPATGLMWQVQAPDKGIHWQQAMDYCANLDLGGYTDWRLPTISELRSLIRGCNKTATGGVCGVTDDCLAWGECLNDSCKGCDDNKGPANGCYWPGNMQGECGGYWSSSSVANGSGFAWIVGFEGGDVYNNGKDGWDGYRYARCVRLGP